VGKLLLRQFDLNLQLLDLDNKLSDKKAYASTYIMTTFTLNTSSLKEGYTSPSYLGLRIYNDSIYLGYIKLERKKKIVVKGFITERQSRGVRSFRGRINSYQYPYFSNHEPHGRTSFLVLVPT
jgi:hypothetical protein